MVSDFTSKVVVVGLWCISFVNCVRLILLPILCPWLYVLFNAALFIFLECLCNPHVKMLALGSLDFAY